MSTPHFVPAHRIRLHGPWQTTVAGHQDFAEDSIWTRIKLPGSITGAANAADPTLQTGHLVIRRSWNRPTGLVPTQLLAVVLQATRLPSAARCNETKLEHFPEAQLPGDAYPEFRSGLAWQLPPSTLARFNQLEFWWPMGDVSGWETPNTIHSVQLVIGQMGG